ncbi:MAG TPA: hypothetical protein DEH78_25650 [Solibacterales bacterium]|nr:hypothetical protein [Bryobacterales bacterium]
MRRSAALVLLLSAAAAGQPFDKARANGREFERDVAAAHRLLRAWMQHADPKTLLLPDQPAAEPAQRVYTPHNSGADLYPYLVLTAELTDGPLYRGRMREMLRNEVRYTAGADGVPGNLTFASGELGPPSLFGAGEYAKDGLITITEYLGRTPWFYRLVDLVAAAMARAGVPSKFGPLPARDAELNGDYLQVLSRLWTMTGDRRFLDWARRIGDAYANEVLPGNHGVPAAVWDFDKHVALDPKLKLRDHGNEAVVGLVLLDAVDGGRYRAPVSRMLDRILASANEDGMLYNEVDPVKLSPLSKGLSDNWGYVYGAVYTFYQSTGEGKYRDAVRRVLRNLPKYRRWAWEPSRRERIAGLGSFDGYADSIEGAIYLYNREPVPEALEWIDSEIQLMLSMQRDDGHVEDWYGEGNFNRTALLHAYLKSAGVRPAEWKPGVRVGAVREGDRLFLSLAAPAPTTLHFDFARHRRVLNLDRNYVRLNEFPEWFPVEENRLYRLRRAGGPEEMVRLGSELIAGITLEPGDWEVFR